MRPAIPYEELVAKLAAAPDRTRLGLYFAAVLADAASIPTDEFFVVGGSAIEIYTVGEYSSGDIDIVSSRIDRLRGVLKSWTFERAGRVWINQELGVVVDLVGYPYTGDFEKTTIMTTPYGPVRLAAIEDLLVKRLISTKFWKQEGDFDQAKLLAVQFSDRIDWSYVEQFAQREEVSDLLALIRGAMASRSRGRKSS
jgi:hypothetical protein